MQYLNKIIESKVSNVLHALSVDVSAEDKEGIKNASRNITIAVLLNREEARQLESQLES